MDAIVNWFQCSFPKLKDKLFMTMLSFRYGNENFGLTIDSRENRSRTYSQNQMSNVVLITRVESILFHFFANPQNQVLSKNRHDFSNKAVLKQKIPQNVFIKKCSPKLLFSTEIFLSKILGIFNLKIILKSQILALFDKAQLQRFTKKKYD